jgi:hypothetical protein
MSTSLVTIEGWVLEQAPGEPRRIQDLELAKRLGYARPRKIRELIRRPIEAGQLSDVLDRGPAPCGGAPNNGPIRDPAFAAESEEHEYWLTRNQALKVAARSETPPADALLDEMIRAFELAIDGRLQLPPPKPVTALPERVQAAAVMARAVGEVLQLSPQSVAASILDFGRREGGLELPGLAPQLPGVGRTYTATELGTHPSVLGKLIKASGIRMTQRWPPRCC